GRLHREGGRVRHRRRTARPGRHQPQPGQVTWSRRGAAGAGRPAVRDLPADPGRARVRRLRRLLFFSVAVSQGRRVSPVATATRSAVVINPSKVTDIDQRRREICAALAEAGWAEPLWIETTREDPGCGQTR